MSQATVVDQEATYSTSGVRPLRLTAKLVLFESPLRETRPTTLEPLTDWNVLVAEPPPEPPLPLHSARSATKREQEARTRVDSRMRRIAISFRERAGIRCRIIFFPTRSISIPNLREGNILYFLATKRAASCNAIRAMQSARRR